MINISNFFHKFFELDKKNKLKTEIIIETIKKISEVNLKTEDLEFFGDKIKIKTKPIIRNQVFMRKEEIEDFLRKRKIFISLV